MDTTLTVKETKLNPGPAAYRTGPLKTGPPDLSFYNCTTPTVYYWLRIVSCPPGRYITKNCTAKTQTHNVLTTFFFKMKTGLKLNEEKP